MDDSRYAGQEMRTGTDIHVRNNQTAAHRELVEKAMIWIANKATLKGIRAASEFCPTSGYSADLLAIMAFQLQYNDRYIPDNVRILGPGQFLQPDCVLIFEAKASRFDFDRHFGPEAKNERLDQPLGHLHWVVAPDGLIDNQEVPKWWGLLESSGRGLREIKKPTYCPMTQDRLNAIGYDMLWARESRAREYECERVMKIVEAMRGKEPHQS